MNEKMNEKRNVQRIAIERPVSFSCEDKQIHGKMIDLSETGTKIIIKSSCLSSLSIAISFGLNPSNQEIKIKGKVVHCCEIRGECLMGIEFNEENSPNKKIIRDYIQQHQR